MGTNNPRPRGGPALHNIVTAYGHRGVPGSGVRHTVGGTVNGSADSCGNVACRKCNPRKMTMFISALASGAAHAMTSIHSMFGGFNKGLNAANSLTFLFSRGYMFAFGGGRKVSVRRLVLSLVSCGMRSRFSRSRRRKAVAVCNSPGDCTTVRGRLRRYNFRRINNSFACVPGSLGSIAPRRHRALSGVMRHLRRFSSIRAICAGVGPTSRRRRWGRGGLWSTERLRRPRQDKDEE